MLLIAAIQGGEITDRERYGAETEFLLGSGSHTVGSLMLSRIDSGSGLDAVMAVLSDPRTLLLAYNEAVSAGEADAGVFVFDPGIATELASIGAE